MAESSRDHLDVCECVSAADGLPGLSFWMRSIHRWGLKPAAPLKLKSRSNNYLCSEKHKAGTIPAATRHLYANQILNIRQGAVLLTCHVFINILSSYVVYMFLNMTTSSHPKILACLFFVCQKVFFLKDKSSLFVYHIFMKTYKHHKYTKQSTTVKTSDRHYILSLKSSIHVKYVDQFYIILVQDQL